MSFELFDVKFDGKEDTIEEGKLKMDGVLFGMNTLYYNKNIHHILLIVLENLKNKIGYNGR